jgi:tRNA A-37 threonylcarbamoyl transferase component Bud32
MSESSRPEPNAALETTRAVDPAAQLRQLWRREQAPDVEGFLRRVGPLPVAQLVSVLRIDQRQRWQRGERVSAEDYLQRQPTLHEDPEAALDLIFGEFVLREQLDEAPPPEEYLQRFPRYRPQLERLFLLDRALLSEPPEEESTLHDPGICPPTVGRYRIISLLGEGGQALVYRAVHPTLGKDVVLKWARGPLPPETGEKDRLLAEGRILAALDQPGLARVYDLDVHEGRPFLVMEYIPGRTLAQARQTVSTPAQAAALVARVARALAAAHGQGVLHLDIKPKNVLVDDDGAPHLIDFGLARLQHAYADDRSRSGQVSGTVQYMAPEQARGEAERIGSRSDVFGLGGLLYYLLTGRAPFEAPDFSTALELARRGNWDRAALHASGAPPALQAVCVQALAPDPDDRYPGAADLAEDLEAFLRRPRRRALVAAAVALLVLAGLALWPWRPQLWLSTGATDADPVPHAPALTVRVWAGGPYRDLTEQLPLCTGDQLQVVALVPTGLHASLFLLNGAGELEHLADLSAASPDRVLRYPAQEEQVAPLTGPPGTECLVLCGRRSGPVTVDEVRGLWDDGPWPALPDLTVLRLEPDGVRAEHHGRDLGSPRERPDPVRAVSERLEALRQQLAKHCDYVEGLAFAHRP